MPNLDASTHRIESQRSSTLIDRRRAASILLASATFAPIPGQSAPHTAIPSSMTAQEWQMLCWATLVRQMRYPEHLIRKNADAPPADAEGPLGISVLRIRVDRTGKILQVEIETSSGIPDFDVAALEGAWRANPLPPAPMAVTTAEPVFIVPISFKP